MALRSLGQSLLPGEGEAGYSERALTRFDGTRVQAVCDAVAA